MLLPPLSRVLVRTYADTINGVIPHHIIVTSVTALTGYALAAVVGIVLGAAMAMSARVRYFVEPLVSLAFPIPKISFTTGVIGARSCTLSPASASNSI